MTDAPRIGLLYQIFRTSQLAASVVSDALEGTGVRGDDYAVYSLLLHGPYTLTEVAQGTGLPLTTAAGYLNRFEERGHVVREPNPADGRSHLVSLTPEARTWVLEVAKTFTENLSTLDSLLSEMEIDTETSIDVLIGVQQALDRATKEGSTKDNS